MCDQIRWSGSAVRAGRGPAAARTIDTRETGTEDRRAGRGGAGHQLSETPRPPAARSPAAGCQNYHPQPSVSQCVSPVLSCVPCGEWGAKKVLTNQIR